MLDVLLINPPPCIITISDYRFQNVPLSLVYIAGYIRKLGFKVSIIDAYNEQNSVRDVVRQAARAKPRIVGITCDASRVPRIKAILGNLKLLLPHTLLVLGGYFPSFVQDEFFMLADVIVKGEGEGSFAEVIKKFLNNKPLDDIRGIYLKDEKGYKWCGSREPIKPLDDFFFPAWDLVSLKKNFYYWARRWPVATLVTSRGCPFDCIFCTIPALWGHEHRQISVERLINELKILQDRYRIEEIYFKDNIITLNRKWVYDFCNGLLRNKLRFSWTCGTSVKCVDYDMLKIMKEAGCHTICYGFESGCQETLNRIGKSITVEENMEAAAMTKKAGIRVFGFFMLGFPFEKRRDMEETLDLAKRIAPYTAMFTLATPFPGTKLWYSLGLDKTPQDTWAWEEINWYSRHASFGDVSVKEILQMKHKGMHIVRSWKYWFSYFSLATPKMILRQILRLFWIFKVYFSPKYRSVKKIIPRKIFY